MRHLRPAELAAVRRKARADFTLNHGSAGGDLLSPEFSPARPAPRPKSTGPGPGPGRVIPLRPDLAGWTRPLVGGALARPFPGRGRHHRPEPPLRPALEGYAHRTSVVVGSRERVTTDKTGNAPLSPARQPGSQVRKGVRRCASRVRAYVAHPARDLAPLTLAVRAYLSREVR